MFACDFEPGDVVANLDWERKLGRSLALPFFKGEGRLAKRQPLEIKGPHDARFHCAGSRSPPLGGEPTRCIVGTRKRSRARQPALYHRDRMLPYEPRQRFHELIPPTDIDTVCQPDQLDLRCSAQETLESR